MTHFAILYLAATVQNHYITITERDPVLYAFYAVLAVATIALAIYTAGLFGATRDVAKKTGELATKTHEVALKTQELAQDTVVAAKLSDQHHQESLMPLVRFVGEVHATPSPQPGFCTAYVNGELVNSGLGPAIGCELSVSGLGETRKVGPIGAGERIAIKHEVYFGYDKPPDRWPWMLAITYQNFAGQPAKTEHHHWLGTARTEYNTVYTPAPIVERV